MPAARPGTPRPHRARKKLPARAASVPRASQSERATSRRAPSSDARAVIAELERRGVRHAKIGGFDVDGVLRGKYVSFDKLRSALTKGFGFCDVIFGWDVADALYDNATLTGWHTAYPDAHAVLDPATLRILPWEDGVAALLCDFRDGDGNPHPACSRSLLKRVIARAQAAGFEPRMAVEFEFFLFKETRESLHEKHFRDLDPLDPGMFGYSWIRSGQDSELMQAILAGAAAFDIELEGLHPETGPGVYEAAIRYDEALRAADKAALFKTVMKQIAHRFGLSACFMAKWNADLPGCSGHVHQSLWTRDKSAFYDARAPLGMSDTMRHYLAGQLELMGELTALVSPTINSYKRYVPGVWAPLRASWGVENRTVALRVIGAGDPAALRVEHRQPAADMNPYLALAAVLAAGLWGIERRAKLEPAVVGDAGENGSALPRTLKEATGLLRGSVAARELFGKSFVEHYAGTRDWEVRRFERAVTDWELARYFEII